MRTFVMGDIHGRYQALLQCLERSGFDRSRDRLIQLGDVVDRGPGSYDCVEELLSIKNLVALRGNHDEWFRHFLAKGWHPSGWELGAVATAQSYLRLTGRERLVKKGNSGWKTALEPGEVPAAHKEFFEKQVDWFIDEDNNCFVHAGFDRLLPFSEQYGQSIYYWDRSLWQEALAWLAGHLQNRGCEPFYVKTAFNNIFLGHTSTVNWKKDKPMKAAHIYNLDTGAGGQGRLTIMDVATKKFWQSDPVTDEGGPKGDG